MLNDLYRSEHVGSEENPLFSAHRSGSKLLNRCPRQRLRPYGEMSEPTPDSAMLEKANAINWEYLLRPAVALSELAEAVLANSGAI